MALWIGVWFSEGSLTRLVTGEHADVDAANAHWTRDAAGARATFCALYALLMQINSPNARLLQIPYSSSVKQIRIWMQVSFDLGSNHQFSDGGSDRGSGDWTLRDQY